MSWGSNHPTNQSLYDILGVSKQDSCADIKKAYYKLTRTHHPDKGGDPERFKEISKANEILSDEKRRQMYDQFGVTDDQVPQTMNHGFQMPQMPPGFSFPFEMNINDLFGGMFGNHQQRSTQRKGKKPAPTVQTIPIKLEQFYMGHKFDININRQSFCQVCDHTGALVKEVCRVCHGQGSIKHVVQVGPMEMHTVGPCTECQGTGQRVVETCNKCTGTGYQSEKRNLSVNILPGTKTEEVFIFSEVCSDNVAYERPGDVHIIIKEDSDDPSFKYFKRSGDALQHLETKISISLAESLIGCVIQMDTHPGYDEGLFIKIPAGSFHGDTYCLTGFGMPIPGHIGSHGDLIIHINVTVKPVERTIFTTKGRELLVDLFQDKIRTTVCSEDAIQTELQLHKL